MFSTFKTLALIAAAASSVILGVNAESHVVRFNNKCGKGTPTLIVGGKVVSTGGEYHSDGPISGAIAYLQTGGCGFNGDNCTLVEATLVNGISSADVSLIPPHTFNVASGFSFFNGCDGVGARCGSAKCPVRDAFHHPDDYVAQRQCNTNNVGLAITFC